MNKVIQDNEFLHTLTRKLFLQKSFIVDVRVGSKYTSKVSPF